MIRNSLIAASSFLGLAVLANEEASPRLHSVLISAQVQSDPVQFELSWTPDSKAKSYRLSRRTPSDPTWTLLTTLPGDRAGFVDKEVTAHARYEYQVLKTTPEYTGYGYLSAGIELPLIEQRGTVLLIVANTFAADLSIELKQLEGDLVGDGWTVRRHDVSPNDTVQTVKGLIQADFQTNPGETQAALLFGRVPVPYSGAIAPDGHTNHAGAWPADAYYADLSGEWTDSTVNMTTAERPRNWNIPGDGKFDQSIPPGQIDVELGRVDFSDLTSFANKTPSRSEKDLLRQYLIKNHQFRHGLLQVERKALICDNFFDKGSDPVGCSGWRNFSGFFGPQGIVEAGWSNYFSTVSTQRFLWSFASGGGQYTTCIGVGSSDDFALHDVGAVFTMWLGSYFGDWDNESNFLRAALGSSNYTLTASYSGFPQWLYHPMALGQTVGHCARLTQNNRARGLYPPISSGVGQVHIALLGDPTLRMHPVLPPSGLMAVSTNGVVKVSWTPSHDPDIRGYHIYRSASLSGPFARLTGDPPMSDPFWTDAQPKASEDIYMVRAVKLERSSSGTYLNASQGIFAKASLDPGTPAEAPTLRIRSLSDGQVRLSVSGLAGRKVVVEVSEDLSSWQELANVLLAREAVEVIDPGQRTSHRFYRAR